MSTLFNRVRVNTATTGTGTVTLGAATSTAYFTFAEAGVPNATVVSYVIEDGNDVEFGVGTYTSAGTTLSRDTVTASKIGGTAGTSKINLSGAAVVFITALANDLIVGPSTVTDTAVVLWDGSTGNLVKESAIAYANATTFDVFGSLAGSTLNFAITNPATAASSQAQMTLSSGSNAGFAIVSDHNQNASFFTAYLGGLVFASAEAITFATDARRMIIADTGEVGVGASALVPDRTFHVEADTATTNAVTYAQRLTSTSSGTPANGIGVGLEFEVETAAGNNEVGATIEAVTTDVTSTSEDFDVVIKAMTAGATAAEVARFKNANIHTIASGSLPAAANLNITDIPARYSYLVLHVDSASFGAASNMSAVRFSTNNGSSYDGTSGNYPGQKVTTTTWTVVTAASATAVESATHTAAQADSFTLTIRSYQGGTTPRYDFRAISNGVEYQGFGTYIGSTSAINAIRVFGSAGGSFDAGTYTLYGIY